MCCILYKHQSCIEVTSKQTNLFAFLPFTLLLLLRHFRVRVIALLCFSCGKGSSIRDMRGRGSSIRDMRGRGSNIRDMRGRGSNIRDMSVPSLNLPTETQPPNYRSFQTPYCTFLLGLLVFVLVLVFVFVLVFVLALLLVFVFVFALVLVLALLLLLVLVVCGLEHGGRVGVGLLLGLARLRFRFTVIALRFSSCLQNYKLQTHGDHLGLYVYPQASLVGTTCSFFLTQKTDKNSLVIGTLDVCLASDLRAPTFFFGLGVRL